VALTLRTPTEAAVFEQEQRRQRQDFDRRPSTPRAPERFAGKAGIRNVEKDREASQKKALVQIRGQVGSTRSKKHVVGPFHETKQKQSFTNDGKPYSVISPFYSKKTPDTLTTK